MKIPTSTICANGLRRSLLMASVVCALIAQRSVALSTDEYVVILRAKGNPYWNTLAQGIKDAAKEKEVTSTVYFLQGEGAAEEQLNTCMAAIQRVPKFLGISAANTSVGIECLRRASAAGIKVADVDCSIPQDDAKRSGLKLAFAVGSDNYKIGTIAAQYAGKILGSDSGNIFVLEGAPGSIAGTLRVRGFVEGLKSAAPQAKIVSSISGEWDRLKAMNTTNDILQQFPAISLIYAANDMMALGAVEAIKAQGKHGAVRVIGVDGTEDARRAVIAGDMAATVAQLPYLIGKRTLELGVESVAAKNLPERESTQTPVLTREVLADPTSLAQLNYVK